MLCVITPIAAVRPRASPCAITFGRYWSLFTISSTAARLFGATGTVPLSTRDTVLDETPASRAISWIVMVLLMVFGFSFRQCGAIKSPHTGEKEDLGGGVAAPKPPLSKLYHYICSESDVNVRCMPRLKFIHIVSYKTRESFGL